MCVCVFVFVCVCVCVCVIALIIALAFSLCFVYFLLIICSLHLVFSHVDFFSLLPFYRFFKLFYSISILRHFLFDFYFFYLVAYLRMY